MQETCPACGASHLTTTPYINRTVPGVFFDTLSIHVCADCGFGFSLPFIGVKELSDFYRSKYRSEDSSHYSPKGGAADSFSSRAASQLLLAKTFRDFVPGEEFLEIGPGGNATIIAARELLPGTKCIAVEPDSFSQDSIRRAGGEAIEAVFSAEPLRELADRKFGLVIMSHVLEHYNASDLPAVLNNIRTLLSDEGIFLCEVPGVEVRNQPGYEDTPHLSFFSETALRGILEKSGLEVIFCSGTGLKNIDAILAAQKVADINSRVTIKGRIRLALKAAVPETVYKFIYRSFRKASLAAGSSAAGGAYAQLSSPDFSYGPDRECIRCVCRKGDM